MKFKHPRITLLGNNAGNNLGDAAILSAILDVISKQLPDAEFFVPSIKPSFINKNYSDKYNVKGVDVMPWTLSARLFGLPTLACFAKSDIALICDGIIFGKKFFNPTFNFLITLILLVPFAKLFNCKLVCYSCGIGPFPVWGSKWAAKVVMNASDLVIMRENDSKALAQELGVTKEISVTGDAAFVNPVTDQEKVQKIAKQHNIDLSRPCIGINVTKYIDGWLEQNERLQNKGQLIDTIADEINYLKNNIQPDLLPIVFSTHPMDEEICKDLCSRIDGTLADNSTFLSHDLQGLMRECELFIGMRFHSLVLSTAVGCPIIGLVYAPKVRGFMRLLESEEVSLELKDTTPERLREVLTDAWKNRQALKAKQQPHIDTLKQGAYDAAVQLSKKYFSNCMEQANSSVSTQAA